MEFLSFFANFEFWKSVLATSIGWILGGFLATKIFEFFTRS